MGKREEKGPPMVSPLAEDIDPPNTLDSDGMSEPTTPNYPPGVTMHQTGALPHTIDRAKRIEQDPKAAPPDWKGPVVRCGGCGNFLGNADRCPACAPAHVQPHAFNSPVRA